MEDYFQKWTFLFSWQSRIHFGGIKHSHWSRRRKGPGDLEYKRMKKVFTIRFQMADGCIRILTWNWHNIYQSKKTDFGWWRCDFFLAKTKKNYSFKRKLETKLITLFFGLSNIESSVGENARVYQPRDWIVYFTYGVFWWVVRILEIKKYDK
jgi:hypothetical protein